MMNYRKYFSVIIVINLFWLTCAIMNYFYLKHNGESLTIAEIIKLQNSDPSLLYGTAINENTISYKLELYKDKKPKIIALGQSRVMQFRDYFFSQSFINMGGAWSNMRLTKQLAQEIIDEYQPEVVIISVDYWLFNLLPEGSIGQYSTKNNPLAGVVKPWIWLKERKISFSEYFQDLFNQNQQLKNIGIMGRYQHTGFGGDGSYYYNNFVFGHVPSNDPHFESTLSHLKDKDWCFESSVHMSQEKFNNFLDILNIFYSKGIKVVLFMPPLAPTVYGQLAQELSHFAYYQEVAAEFAKNHLYYADYFNPASVDSDDCEFVDGLHPGDLVYAKILLRLANTPEYRYLHSYINTPLLKEITHTYKHIAFIPQKESQTQEIDFLDIGCKKIKQIPLIQLASRKV